MKMHGTMNVNHAGHLEIGGCDTVELAKEYGTPLYIMDEPFIREKCRSFVKAFSSLYPDVEIVYAGKAFLSMAQARIMEQEGLSLDVVSGGELYTASGAGFPAEKIYFHGNNKSPEELRMALDLGVGHVVVDNINELKTLNHIAGFLGKKQRILIRLSPGITGNTHQYIQTGQLDSKFGFPLYQDIAFEAVKQALSCKNLMFAGLHCHIGSQILDIKSFVTAARIVIEFAARLKSELNCESSVLNLGGGFGIYYTKQDRELLPLTLAEEIVTAVKETLNRYGLPYPRLVLEPGRFIVGNAGTTLYTVGGIKEIPSVRKYVFIDGGMADNPRPALYQAKYQAVVANKMNRTPAQEVTIAGRCCESSDVLIRDIMLPRVEKGDLIAVLSTGAYNYSMASNYNRIPRPAVILAGGGKADLIIQRESYQDLIKNDIIPDRLKKSCDF